MIAPKSDAIKWLNENKNYRKLKRAKESVRVTTFEIVKVTTAALPRLTMQHYSESRNETKGVTKLYKSLKLLRHPEKQPTNQNPANQNPKHSRRSVVTLHSSSGAKPTRLR